MTRPFDPETLPAPSRLPDREGLPDPFTTFEGTSVRTEVDWERRRAELVQLFRHYMYGYAPEPPALSFAVGDEHPVAEGRGTLRTVEITYPELPAETPTLRLSLFRPVDADEPPVIVGLNKRGNHTVAEHQSLPVATEGTAEDRGRAASNWCFEYFLERGYAFATFHAGDLDPDRDDFTDGLHPYFDDEVSGPAGTEWGTIAAWAWGFHRCVDYLVETDDIDGDQIGVSGHSRRGKTALLAGATDERIALVNPHQSGTGGCALSRDNDHESVSLLTGAQPHWFNDLFHGFAGRPQRIPIDQHLLIALVAPRAIIATEGARDLTANPGRCLDALQAAAPVWELLGETGIVGEGILYGDAAITPSTVGDVLQHRLETGHTLNRSYWENILDFADVHLEH